MMRYTYTKENQLVYVAGYEKYKPTCIASDFDIFFIFPCPYTFQIQISKPKFPFSFIFHSRRLYLLNKNK